MREGMVKGLVKKHGVSIALAIDAVVVGAYWFLIPQFKRPFEGLMIVVAVLGILTAVLSRRSKWLPTASLMIASTAFAVFGLEMSQKFFNVVDFFESKPAIAVSSNKYAWDALDAASYVRAREQALADGADREAFVDDFGGDVFAREGLDKLRVRTHKRGDKIDSLESASEDSPWLRDPPLGSELRPNNVFRQYCYDENLGRMMYDGFCHTGPYGYRVTKGNEESDEAYVFMGCSFTFGSYLSDHQTLPYYFSELHGFGKRVINLAIGGNGPHHSLRDLELDYRLGKAGVKPGQVKAVVYSYMDSHALRVISPTPEDSPRYVLDKGKLELSGTFRNAEDLSRFDILIMRSRIVPRVMEKFQNKNVKGDLDLTCAILAEMSRICRDRYGVPLTLVYWEEDPETLRRFMDMDVRLVLVKDAFEEGSAWPEMGVKYKLFDGHPNPYGNKKLAEHVFRVFGDE